MSRMFLAYLPTDGVGFPKSLRHLSWITLPALFLRVRTAISPSALVDIEDEDHHLIHGSWLSDTSLESVPVGRDGNLTRTCRNAEYML